MCTVAAVVHDYGAEPVVLIVFDDPLVEARFLGVARSEMARRRVKVPLWVSFKEALEKVGPLGATWRNPTPWSPPTPSWGPRGASACRVNGSCIHGRVWTGRLA